LKVFDLVQKSNDNLQKQHVAASIAKATDMLSTPRKWSGDTFQHIQCAANFELACRDKKSFYLHMLAHEDEWSVLLNESLAPLQDRDVWLVIDVRTLFRKRGALIA
jgi:hypothetical protein